MGSADAIFTPDQFALIEKAESHATDVAADFLFQLAAMHWRAGEAPQFAECFRRAYRLRPSGAMPLIVTEGRDPRDALAELRAKVAAMARHGVVYSRVLSQLAIAEAKLGDPSAVRGLVDYERFFRLGHCAPPTGMTLDGFNDAVAAEIKADMRFYDAPDDRAIRRGWRHDTVLRASTPALGMLRKMLEAQVEAYIAALPKGEDNLFLASRPARYRLDGWAVISDGDTYHVPHIHPAAWATGVYYVTRPDVSRDSRRGWLHVGPPDADIGAAQGWESRMVEPERGAFVLMPAYFFHATEPMGVDQERICLAFEVQYPEVSRMRGANY